MDSQHLRKFIILRKKKKRLKDLYRDLFHLLNIYRNKYCILRILSFTMFNLISNKTEHANFKDKYIFTFRVCILCIFAFINFSQTRKTF